MKRFLLAFGVLVAVCTAPVHAQRSADVAERLAFLDQWFTVNQIQLRLSRTGGEPTPDEQRLFAEFQARMRGAGGASISGDSLGIVPLTELRAGAYKGVEGGLYPGYRNTPPPAHARAGGAIARAMEPIGAEGQADPAGKIVFLSIGYSNWTQEFSAFAERAMNDPERNPNVVVIDGAVGAQSTGINARADAEYYNVVDQRLSATGVSPQQVQVVMLKVATPVPWLPFPGESRILQDFTRKTVHVLQDRFPNLKLLYLTSRTYGGHTDMPLNPEPYAFETGFAVKWLIADQIGGDPALNYDPSSGPVRAPWLAWGPYLWADGMRSREDGLQWHREDFGDDLTHPSDRGIEKVVTLIEEFLKNDPIAKRWYVRR